MAGFSFGFAGDDIDAGDASAATRSHPSTGELGTPTARTTRPRSTSAFPVDGQPLLPAQEHLLDDVLATLPSAISYSTLNVELDGKETITLPRRELWDVRVQLMAEAEVPAADKPGLGNVDVKTGVYEGGFKSWECAVDLVRVLATQRTTECVPRCVLELGCGTALPSLALFQWHLRALDDAAPQTLPSLHLLLADYNPTVLQLVTLPNLLLSWRQAMHPSDWAVDGELEITPLLLEEFKECLDRAHITLSFFSGAWGDAFLDVVQARINQYTQLSFHRLLLLGAETIYSPLALERFTYTMMELLHRYGQSVEKPDDAPVALVGAKKVYFGVGGSIEDFYEAVLVRDGVFEQIQEESDGVRRVSVEVRSMKNGE